METRISLIIVEIGDILLEIKPRRVIAGRSIGMD
jgi:hypothetical protein